MQVEWEGQYLYLYSGRKYATANPDMTQIGKEDEFTKVQCIKINSITSVDIDHKDFTVTIWVGARPIHCSFGDRNCYKINCHGAFVEVLTEALSFDRERIWNLGRRNSQTALSVQRGDECHNEDSE
jgi:hypothetical protein